MRLLSIKLVNYIGIYNGSGKRELLLNFDNAKPIIAVTGHNGSGKSTLLRALQPFPDGYEQLIPNCEAYKELVYAKDDHLYEIKIKYTHYDDKNSTEVAIIKDGVNLNTNLNVTSAKDIIMNEFELDSNYIALSQLSSEDRGLADKRPSERKKFVNDILADLTVYNNMYKILNKKSGNFKNLINNLAYKINTIGDNLPLLESNLTNLETRLTGYEKDKENLIAEQTTIKNAMDLQKEVKEECAQVLFVYNKAMDDHAKIVDKINEAKAMIPENEITDCDPKDLADKSKALYTETNKIIAGKEVFLQAEMDRYQKLSAKINDDISQKNIKTNQLHAQTDIDVDINSFLEWLTRSEDNKNSLQKKLSNIAKPLLTSSVTTEMVNNLYSELESMKYAVYSLTSIHTFSDLDKLNLNQLKDNHEVLSKALIDTEEYYENIKNKSLNYTQLEHIEDVPSNCNRNDCYFCRLKKQYNKDKKKIDEQNKELKNTEIRLDTLRKELQYNTEFIHEAQNALRYASILDINKDIIDEVISLQSKENKTKLKNITQLTQHISILLESIETVIDLYNLKKEFTVATAEYNDAMERYIKVKDNIDTIKTLQKEISDLDANISSEQEEYNKISDVVRSTQQELYNLKNKASVLNDCISLGEEFNQICKDLINYETEYTKHKDAINRTTELDAKYKDIGDKIQDINNNIKIVKEEYDNTKFNVRALKEYKTEYDAYINNYQKIETIKRFTSPTTGIQTLFMETYMNNVLIVANQLLALMFNGEFVLQPFIINESEFRIPCAGSGYLNDDISSMSNSQICIISMIISFAMLYNSSSCYNIIKLDEIDAALDTDNRIKFVEMLYQIMQIMQCEQCFIISHNMELDDNEITKIVMG